MPRQKDPILRMKNKYGITDNEIIIPEDNDLKKVIRKSGILKIQKKENIRISIDQMIVHDFATKAGVEDGVYLTGTGKIINSKGFVVNEVQATSSATPYNCTFQFKAEVAEIRLKSRLVLDLAEMTEWLSEDELSLSQRSSSSKNPNEQQLGEDLILQAIEGVGKSNRLKQDESR